MPQQVWVFLLANGESWAAPDLARRLNMPLGTVRGQLHRLHRDGKVTARKYAGRVLYQAKEAR